MHCRGFHWYEIVPDHVINRKVTKNVHGNLIITKKDEKRVDLTV